MDFLKLIETRQSCRNFNPRRDVEREKLDACLKAARLAPSACNSQPYHFYVATGEAAKAVGACTRSMGLNGFTADCPALVVVTEAPYNATAAVGAKRKHQDYRSIDIGIAAAYFTAQATELGLSSCIIGWFDEKKLQALLKTQARIRLILAVGYASDDDPLRPKKRKFIEQLADWIDAV